MKKGTYFFDVIGSNFRTNELQSIIGITQLKKIDKFLKNRIKISEIYKKNISNLTFQKIPNYVTKHPNMVFFAFAKNKKTRDRIIKYLNKNGIDAKHAWVPIHLQPCNPEMHKIKNKNSERAFNNGLFLPLYNDMKINDAKLIVKKIENFTRT